MDIKVVDTFHSSEFRLQAVVRRGRQIARPPEGGTPNCKLTNEGCQKHFSRSAPASALMQMKIRISV